MRGVKIDSLNFFFFLFSEVLVVYAITVLRILILNIFQPSQTPEKRYMAKMMSIAVTIAFWDIVNVSIYSQ